MKLIIYILALTLLSQVKVKGDLPINCKKQGGDVNYVGKVWSFHISKEEQEVSLYEQTEVCTHKMPNKL